MSFPATYNISYYKGDTYEFVVIPKNSDGTDFGLTGYTALLNISNKLGGGGSFFTSGQAVVSTTNNTVTCTILPGVGTNLNSSTTYYYDVQITDGSTKVFTLLNGIITVTDDVRA
jgi:hypothetical protein